MNSDLIQYLTELLDLYYKPNTSIGSVEILESKLFRVIYRIKSTKGDLVLHFRQRSFQEEKEHEIMKHPEINGIVTPGLIYYDITDKNPFKAAFFLQKYISGKKLSENDNWLKKNTPLLLDNLLKLHGIKAEGNVIPKIQTLIKYKTECLQKLKSHQSIDISTLEEVFDLTIGMISDINFESVQASFLHGDLHYSNIIISDDNRCYLIDWENSSVGDYCQDLSYFKARTLDLLYPDSNDDIFESMLSRYQKAFNDINIYERIRFYLSLQYLELIWRSCFPKITEKWLQFYFKMITNCKFLKDIGR